MKQDQNKQGGGWGGQQTGKPQQKGGQGQPGQRQGGQGGFDQNKDRDKTDK